MSDKKINNSISKYITLKCLLKLKIAVQKQVNDQKSFRQVLKIPIKWLKNIYISYPNGTEARVAKLGTFIRGKSASKASIICINKLYNVSMLNFSIPLLFKYIL